jgi:hypothetical protein
MPISSFLSTQAAINASRLLNQSNGGPIELTPGNLTVLFTGAAIGAAAIGIAYLYASHVDKVEAATRGNASEVVKRGAADHGYVPAESGMSVLSDAWKIFTPAALGVLVAAPVAIAMAAAVGFSGACAFAAAFQDKLHPPSLPKPPHPAPLPK